MRLIHSVILLTLIAISARASLLPPERAGAADSLSSQFEQRVEFSRATDYMGVTKDKDSTWSLAGYSWWKTEWQSPRGGVRRVRQDGKWYAGADRNLATRFGVWGAAYGEHFDDRPLSLRKTGRDPAKIFPESPFVEDRSTVFPSQSTNSTRILRGGGGVRVTPWQPLSFHSAVGAVEDKRIGQSETGLGSWNYLRLDDWNPKGFEQDGSLTFLRETPENHNSVDLTGEYSLFREFFPGNSNKAAVAAGLVRRDNLLEASGTLTRRTERYFSFDDELHYDVAEGVHIRMDGDVNGRKTELGEDRGGNSSLEEDQAGVSANLEGTHGGSSGQLAVAIRSINQTIRGDILSGRKTEVSFQGITELRDGSKIGLKTAVSKYILDTRSEDNFDDRDELGYRLESRWNKKILSNMTAGVRALAVLNHLVYIFEQNSANNRWSRLFLGSAEFIHHPANRVRRLTEFTVSANYQDYDFELNETVERSTVFRKLIVHDSTVVEIARKWSVVSDLSFQVEELGRLFWDSFEEERSDETRYYYGAVRIMYAPIRNWTTGAGYLWDSRRGERFLSGDGPRTEVFQELRSYGPTVSIEHHKSHGFFFIGGGRALRQLQLNEESRWIITGDVTGGYRW